MKTKTIFYSNFKYNPNNTSESDKNLIIDEMFNVNTDNGFIQTELCANKLLIEILGEEKATIIETANIDILNKTIRIIPYEFYDEALKSHQCRLFTISTSNSLYELNNSTNLFEQKYNFNTFPNVILSNDILYLFDTDNECVIIENKNLLSIEKLPNIDSFAYDLNYIYFTVKNLPNYLFISETCKLKELSPNLEQYSFISTTIEDGSIYKVINIKQKIYLFSQYSILKLDEENKLIRQNKINLLIYKNTINQIDDYVIFYSSNGMYLFDGNDINQQTDNYLNFTKNAKSVCFNQNLYILSSNYKNFIFKYNVNNKQFLPLKINNIIDIYQVNTYSNYSFCISIRNDNIYQNITIYSDTNFYPQKQMVVFKTTFFDSTKLKQIRNIYIKSSGSFQLKIKSDISSSIFNITNSMSILNLTLDGVCFNFEINSESNFKLNSILINYDEIGE